MLHTAVCHNLCFYHLTDKERRESETERALPDLPRLPTEAQTKLHSERRGGIATAPPLRQSYSDRAVTSPGGAFQTDTNLANHKHRPKLLADCQWRWRWWCELGRLRNTRSLTKTIPRDRRKLIKLMLRKWMFLPPRSHLIRQFVKRHLVTIRREQHVLAQWLRQ